jgi:hypothetical protein
MKGTLYETSSRGTLSIAAAKGMLSYTTMIKERIVCRRYLVDPSSVHEQEGMVKAMRCRVISCVHGVGWVRGAH